MLSGRAAEPQSSLGFCVQVQYLCILGCFMIETVLFIGESEVSNFNTHYDRASLLSDYINALSGFVASSAF